MPKKGYKQTNTIHWNRGDIRNGRVKNVME